jgi:hypothetical protein
MSWVSKLFGKVGLRPKSDFENMLLDRLKRHKVFCDIEGRTFYTDDDNEIYKIKVLGKYSYYDVDGTVSGVVVEKENGEIEKKLFLNILYERKPHNWIIHLNTSQKSRYSQMQKFNTDEQLANNFFKELPKEVIREIKINSIIN